MEGEGGGKGRVGLAATELLRVGCARALRAAVWSLHQDGDGRGHSACGPTGLMRAAARSTGSSSGSGGGGGGGLCELLLALAFTSLDVSLHLWSMCFL